MEIECKGARRNVNGKFDILRLYGHPENEDYFVK